VYVLFQDIKGHEGGRMRNFM